MNGCKLNSRNYHTNTEVWVEEVGEYVHVHHCKISESPVIALMKHNQKERDKEARWGDGKVAASVDPFTMNKLILEGRANDPDDMKKWLNKPSNKHFRTMKGKI